MRYPDPEAVVRPTTMPPKFRPILTSWTKSSETTHDFYPLHNHIAFMDRNGEGTTDLVSAHYHRIRGGVIQPDESDGHTHDLTALSGGAG